MPNQKRWSSELMLIIFNVNIIYLTLILVCFSVKTLDFSVVLSQLLKSFDMKNMKEGLKIISNVQSTIWLQKLSLVGIEMEMECTFPIRYLIRIRYNISVSLYFCDGMLHGILIYHILITPENPSIYLQQVSESHIVFSAEFYPYSNSS